MTELKVYLLGAPRVTRGDVVLETGRRKATAVFIHLLLTPQYQRRETLATRFWPEHSPDKGRADLSRILSVLRKTIGAGWLFSDRQMVGLAADANIWVDVLEFRHRLATVQSHRHAEDQVCATCLSTSLAATDLYQGDFLAGFTLTDSPEFDDWQAWQTESLRRELAEALAKSARWQAQAGDFQSALKKAQRRLNLDPLYEPAQRQLMRIYAWAGDRNAAIRQYQACRRILDVELGLPPEAATRELHAAIQSGRISVLSPVIRADEGSAVPPPNIPSQSTPFVGRQDELMQITALIRDEPACRLLTLVGPGGIGKTRLAVQVANLVVAEATEAFPHGIYFVPLAAIHSPDALVPTIAESLNLSFYSGKHPQEQLLNYLSQKTMLLVLDNLEHLLISAHSSSQKKLVETAELLTAITKRAPQVKLLVTSRERLNLREEWVLEVSGMDFPAAAEVDKTTLATYSAVTLFLQRARRARATFVLAEADMPAVIRICQLVAGTPLGIELAAAWVRMMSCADIALEIERGLDFLTTSLRDVSERHRSLRTVFEQSWNHLSGEETAVFKKLSVFQGGFRLSAAKRVAGATLAALSALVDKSLLRQTRAGRYEIHELMRQFAAEKLAVDPEEMTRARDHHANYFAIFLQQRRNEFQGERQGKILTDILVDMGNIRAAWGWAIVQQNVADIGKAVECFLLTHWLRGWFTEGEAAFHQAILGLSGVKAVTNLQDLTFSHHHNAVLGKLLTGQGFFCIRLGRYRQALELTQLGIILLRQSGIGFQDDLAYGLLMASIVDEVHGCLVEANLSIEEFLNIYRQTGNRWGIGTAMVRLGQVARRQRRLEEAQGYLQEGIGILNSVGDHKGVAYALDDLGHVMRAQGSYRQAQQHFEETLARRQALGDQEGTILSLRNVGDMNRVLGHYAQARQQYQESLTLAREIGYRLKIADSLDGLGMVARLQKEYEQAELWHQESLMIYEELGVQQRVALCLTNLGRLSIDRRQYAQAEIYLQKSSALCQQNGYERETVLCLSSLGYLYLNLEGDRAKTEAENYLYSALALATQVRAVPAALDILLGLALQLSHSKGEERAIELLDLALHHPGSEQETKDRATKVKREVTAVPHTSAAFISAESQPLDLWETVAELMQEATDQGRYHPMKSRQ